MPILLVIITLALSFVPVSAHAGDSDLVLAKRLYQRLTGIRILNNDPRLTQMVEKIQANDLLGAAQIASADDNFINVTVFSFFAEKSNRAENPDTSLNDFIAMGLYNTVSNLPYTNLLTDDFTAIVPSITNPAPAVDSNAHYAAATTNRVNLARSLQIVRPQRAGFTDAAGVLTSRQFMAEHAFAGTNRRIVEFAFREFLCTSMKQWQDADESIPQTFVRKDVDRRPGGDVDQYNTSCRNCHRVLDSLSNAFARFDFPRDQVTHNPTAIAAKINRNNNFYTGAPNVTTDDFVNLATLNHNTAFGWRGNLNGRGAKQFAQMVSRAKRFSSCAVEQVFFQLCKRAPEKAEHDLVMQLADKFEEDNYNLRTLYQRVSILPVCLGERE